MLFLQFILYLSSFAGTLKNNIQGAALELCQLKTQQFSPKILKFSTKHEDNPFTLNCFTVRRTFIFIIHAGLRSLGSSNFQNSSYKQKTDSSGHAFKVSFRFLWLWLNQKRGLIRNYQVTTLQISFIIKMSNMYFIKI